MCSIQRNKGRGSKGFKSPCFPRFCYPFSLTLSDFVQSNLGKQISSYGSGIYHRAVSVGATVSCALTGGTLVVYDVSAGVDGRSRHM